MRGTSTTSTMGYREATTASATTTGTTSLGFAASTETTNQGESKFLTFFMILLSTIKMTLNAPDSNLVSMGALGQPTWLLPHE